MQAAALLGGMGTRLNDRTKGLPKALVDVHGKPFFCYQIELMKSSGFTDFLFCVGNSSGEIEKFFKDGSDLGISITYSYDGAKPLGTGGALRKALGLLEEDFLLIYGDSYMDVDYGELVYNYNKVKSESHKKMLMAVFRNKNRFDRSNVAFRNSHLISYNKKNPPPEAEYIDYGISIMAKEVIARIPQGKEEDVAELYLSLSAEGLAAGYEVRTRFYEIGTPQSLDEFKEFIHRRLYVKKKAVILDRDGTLNETVFNADTGEDDSPMRADQLKLVPKTIEALRTLRSLGYLLIVATNQPSAAKGKTTLGDLYEVNNRLRDILAREDLYLDDILMCPHHPAGAPGSQESFLITDCGCRKPKPGLLLRVVQKFNIDVDSSYSVGDRPADVDAGKAAGLATALIGKDGKFGNLYEFSQYLKNTKGSERCRT